MRHLITFLCLAALYVTGQASAQTAAQSERRRAVLVPLEVLLPVVVSQPDCPLQYEDVRLVKYTEGYLAGFVGKVYRLRNRGSKPIRSYTTAYLTTGGGGNEVTWTAPPVALDSELLMPGQVPPNDGGSVLEIIPLTEELRDKLKLRGPTEGAFFFMVVRVKFNDGTVYSAEPQHKALETYFERMSVKL